MNAWLARPRCKHHRFLRLCKSRCLQPDVKLYTKQSLIEKLQAIAKQGWIPNARHGNIGGIGNTLEDQLEIKENNLPIPNAAVWELKTQRINTTSLTTLFTLKRPPVLSGLFPRCFCLNMGGYSRKQEKDTQQLR